MSALSLHIEYESTSSEATNEILSSLKKITKEQMNSENQQAVTFMFTRPNPDQNIIEFTEIYNKPSLFWETAVKTLSSEYQKIFDSKNLKKQETIAFGSIYQKKFMKEDHLMKVLKTTFPKMDEHGFVVNQCYSVYNSDKKDPLMMKLRLKPKDSNKLNQLKETVSTSFHEATNFNPTVISLIVYEKDGEVIVNEVFNYSKLFLVILQKIDFSSFMDQVESSQLFCYGEENTYIQKYLNTLPFDIVSYRVPDVGFIVNPNLNFESTSIPHYAHDGRYFGPSIRSRLLDSSVNAENQYFNQIKAWIMVDKLEIDKRDFSGKTMLFYACEGGFVSCVKYLLENGSKIENKDYEPLCQASLNYNPEIIRLLVNSGADVNVKDFEQSTPLHWILRNSNDDDELLSILDLFSKSKLNLEAQDSEGNSYLHLSTRYGLLWATKKLIQLGESLESKNNSGNTVLLNCCENTWGWKMDCFRLIYQKGGDLKAKNVDGNSAFHLAAKNGLLPIVKFLSTKLNVNDQNANGNTPIMEASLYNRNVSIVQHLISYQSNLLITNNANMNVLDLALSNYNLDICYILLARLKKKEMIEAVSYILPNFANVEKEMVSKKVDLDKVEIEEKK
jgi:ankyrin repeat protein